MYQHPYIAEQIARDRHDTLRRVAGASRLRRQVRDHERHQKQHHRSRSR